MWLEEQYCEGIAVIGEKVDLNPDDETYFNFASCLLNRTNK